MAKEFSASASFDVKLSFKGKTWVMHGVTTDTTVEEIKSRARDEFDLAESAVLKLLHKGKVLGAAAAAASNTSRRSCACSSCGLRAVASSDTCGNITETPAFPDGVKSRSATKVTVMATNNATITDLNSKRSDPTVRGFDNERKPSKVPSSLSSHWGPKFSSQNKDYKFCRFEACSWQSFGHHRTSNSTKSSIPHAFEANRLLEKLATDPGIVAVMVERELVVGTLGEMDPIDDRLLQQKSQEGACLLGYNTNHGTRIDIKLRRGEHDLTFLPYNELAATLIHELSHNWVGEHDALFWTNYGQMRAEYLYAHASNKAKGYDTAATAGVSEYTDNIQLTTKQSIVLDTIYKGVVKELVVETAPHGVPVQMVAPAVLQRCRELLSTDKSWDSDRGRAVGGGNANNDTKHNTVGDRRSLALAAAERRARQGNDVDHNNSQSKHGANNNDSTSRN